MKTKTSALCLALIVTTSALATPAQEENQPPPPPTRGFGPPPPEDGAPGGRDDDRQPPSPGAHGPPGRPFRGQPPFSELLALFDTNHDGVIDAREIANAPEVLRRLDKNGDGKLTPDELRVLHRPPPPSMPDRARPSEDTSGSVPDDHGRPVALVAAELGVTPGQFREAFKKVRPAPRGERPTDAQRQANRIVLAQALGVSPEKLDAVMDKYRPEGPGREWGVKPGS